MDKRIDKISFKIATKRLPLEAGQHGIIPMSDVSTLHATDVTDDITVTVK